MFSIPLTAAAEKKSYLAGMVKEREREKHTNDCFFLPPQKEKEPNDAFLLFVDDISLKTDNEAPQRGATTAKRIQALLLLLSLHDNLT